MKKVLLKTFTLYIFISNVATTCVITGGYWGICGEYTPSYQSYHITSTDPAGCISVGPNPRYCGCTFSTCPSQVFGACITDQFGSYQYCLNPAFSPPGCSGGIIANTVACTPPAPIITSFTPIPPNHYSTLFVGRHFQIPRFKVGMNFLLSVYSLSGKLELVVGTYTGSVDFQKYGLRDGVHFVKLLEQR